MVYQNSCKLYIESGLKPSEQCELLNPALKDRVTLLPCSNRQNIAFVFLLPKLLG